MPHVSRSRSKTVSPEPLGLGFELTAKLLLATLYLEVLLRPKLPILLYVGTDLGVVESFKFEVEQDLGRLDVVLGGAIKR